MSPFAEPYAPEPTDEDLVRRAGKGDRQALAGLLLRHQAWVFNIALRFLQTREDAEDATQEIVIKVITRLASFRADSSFRTWLYRIAANHLMDRKRSHAERAVHAFSCYADYLDQLPDEDFSPGGVNSPEQRLLIQEAKITCVMGMLLCLDREQRLVFVLGEVFEVADTLGSDVLGLSRDNFRQQLARARQQLYSFMGGKCGLVSADNPCRCARKTKGFIRDGIVDPDRLLFTPSALRRIRDMAPGRVRRLETETETLNRRLFLDHPFYEPAALATRLRALIDGGHL